MKNSPPKDQHSKDQHFGQIEKYFRSEYASMLSFAGYLLNNRSLAEVAVQETFVCALENYEKFESSPNPVGWLYNTLKNMIRHIQRDQQKIIKRMVQLDSCAEDYIASTHKSAMDLCTNKENPDFQLLIRFYVYGYTLKELAQEEGISVGAMTMRIQRAKERIKKENLL